MVEGEGFDPPGTVSERDRERVSLLTLVFITWARRLTGARQGEWRTAQSGANLLRETSVLIGKNAGYCKLSESLIALSAFQAAESARGSTARCSQSQQGIIRAGTATYALVRSAQKQVATAMSGTRKYWFGSAATEPIVRETSRRHYLATRLSIAPNLSHIAVPDCPTHALGAREWIQKLAQNKTRGRHQTSSPPSRSGVSRTFPALRRV